jgi:hypothetical protein
MSSSPNPSHDLSLPRVELVWVVGPDGTVVPTINGVLPAAADDDDDDDIEDDERSAWSEIDDDEDGIDDDAA